LVDEQVAEHPAPRIRVVDGVGEDVDDTRAPAVRLGTPEPESVDGLTRDRADDVGAGDEDSALGARMTMSVRAGP
jgi:hypothetical protein